ncbi:VirB4 family type IV secretion/conjugal transfer ATPase [Massilia glaciei]|uniref:VirB4 family type IV secretion/conjugal transfer ATPase n=1 Tax=Massilia glaciei TaxID=1524097 RepID=A0A2U2I6J2_9BURK|nr:VirB4 family type IV secretion/conjugal transfer ATPase [Massilia glaciei]PWF55367.1 VirB4 family type IV secretion/conjugal transfer ATPase [Massilia glaciei]
MIITLTIVIAVLGALMLLLLFQRIQAANSQLELKKHRSKQAGFADLLNYAAMVDDGVIVGKNGSFMASWLYQGEDNSSSTDEQRDMVSFRLNQALSGMGNGWMIHVDGTRREAPSYPPASASHFPDPLSKAIDEERRRLFESLGMMYEGFFVLTVTYFPPLLAEKKFVEMMFDDETEVQNHKSRTQGLIDTFKRDCANIEARMSAGIKMTRLRGKKVVQEDGSMVTHDDFLRWLQFCVTGLNHPVQLPNNPMYLDSIIGAQEMWSGVVPRIGRKFVQVVSIDGFPLESTPGMLTALAEQPCEYRWSSRFIFMDQHEAVAHLDKFRKKWKQKIRGFFDQVFNTNSGVVDEDAVSMVADAASAIAEANSGLVAQGYYTSVVVLMDENRDKLEASAAMLEKAINRIGFAARVETINTLDAYLGSLPGHGVENVRRPLINTMNLADLLPTSTIWTGLNYAPCPMYPANSPPLMSCVTHGATPFRLNLHWLDLGHTLMLGPTRMGKSAKLALIAFQALRYEGMSIFCYEKGMSMYPTTKGVGGSHFDVGADDSRLAFCPLQFLETKGDRAWAMGWIDTCCALNGVITTPEQRNEIGRTIFNMQESGSKTMTDFVLTIQDESIRAALEQYTVKGMMGHLLDAEEDGLSLSKFTTFELESLMKLGEKYALPVLLYLFRRVQVSLKGQPAMILIDEAWLMLAHAAFRDKIEEWLRSFAKLNCLVLLSTQSLTEAAKSGIMDIIIESTATKIYLPNRDARTEDATALYKATGLNSRQIDILATAVPKRQYYVVSEAGRRLYETALGPLALAFAGSTDKKSIAKIKELEATYGDGWIHEWLAIKGLNLNDYGVTA